MKTLKIESSCIPTYVTITIKKDGLVVSIDVPHKALLDEIAKSAMAVEPSFIPSCGVVILGQ